VKATASVQAGTNAQIVAKVTNKGENAANGYTIVIKAGETELLNQTVNEALQPFKSTEFETELTTTIFDEAGDVTISAEVIFDNDLNQDNDKAETIISIKESEAIGPDNVTAQTDGAGDITLTWTAPDTSAAPQVEDFSSYQNGANATGDIGNWTVVNANGGTKGGLFQDLELPSHGKATAWEVFNLATYGGDSQTFAGADGNVDNNYLISLYNATAEGYQDCDDWLISPELPGVAQTLTFDVKAFNDYGAQTYQVLYSTTGKETTDFQLIQEVTDNGGAWSTVSYELPEGTKYFAIRNITDGEKGFVLAVDNFNYLAGGGEVASYNIYIDGELVATVEGDVTTYIVDPETIDNGDHQFSVTAVYANGKESKPVTTAFEVTTAIEQIAKDGKPVDVYSLDGKLVRQQAKSFDGLKGVYVINGRAVLVK